MTGLSAKRSSGSDAPRLSLGPDQLHLWLWPHARGERSADRLREVLSRYVALAPDAWRFGTGRHGKPHIDNPRVALDFNLSHSGAWLLLAISKGTALGVDLERVDAKRDALRLARRFYAPRECLELEKLPAAQRVERFFDYWTLKEAAIKAAGEALAPALRSREFSVHVSAAAGGGRIRAHFQSAAFFGLFNPLPGYRAAVCWRGERPPAVSLFRATAEREAMTRWRARSAPGP